MDADGKNDWNLQDIQASEAMKVGLVWEAVSRSYNKSVFYRLGHARYQSGRLSYFAAGA